MSNPPRNRPVLALATSHWLAQLGLGIVLTAIVTWIFLAVVEMQRGEDNPYIGVALFAVVPAVLLVGLVLTPLGLWLGRNRLRERLAAGIDDGPRALRRGLLFLAVVSLVNLAIGTQVTYRAVHHMESRDFCGSCHVMKPEATNFGIGAHAGLLCVDCHVGEGASGWVESKIGGTRQLWHVLTDNVPRPIPPGIATGRMVESSETCERCHDRARLGSVRLSISRRYAEDEANTPETTVLTMHVGGTEMGGIHGAHCAPGVEILMRPTDPARQEIPWVQVSDARTGETRTYVQDGVDEADWADVEPVAMQCIDCHNRVAHPFQLPDRALDEAFTLGRLPRELPFLKREALAALQTEHASEAEAARAIPAALDGFYRGQHPELYAEAEAEIAAAAEEVVRIWSRNVFPEHDVTWGSYPDNGGHEDFPGCYRCHSGEHVTDAGDELTQDCFVCHTASAVAEEDPEILQRLGLKGPIERMGQR